MGTKQTAIISTLALTLWLNACDGPPGETEEQKQALDTAADNNQASASCDWHRMEAQRLNRLASVDEADVCNTLQSSLGRTPSVALVRALSKAVFAFQVTGSKDTPREIAYQLMNIVEVRGQRDDDARIDDTFETVFKIFNGTQGHVTPKDLNIALRAGRGVNPQKLDQNGMFTLGAMIWEAKKANGE